MYMIPKGFLPELSEDKLGYFILASIEKIYRITTR